MRVTYHFYTPAGLVTARHHKNGAGRSTRVDPDMGDSLSP